MDRIDWTKESINKLNRDDLLSADLIRQVYEDFAEDPVERASIIAQLSTRARQEQCKGDFDRIVKEQDKAARQAGKPEARGGSDNNVAEFALQADQKPIVVRTGKWTVNEYGVRTWGFTGPLVASNYPIIITRTMTDLLSGKEDVELTWRKNNAVRSIQVPRSYISSNTKIVQLSDSGLPVTSTTANLLINYLSDYEVLNQGIIDHQMSTRRFGWIIRGNNRDFLPYSKSDIKLNYSSMDGRLTKAVTTHGNVSDWLDAYTPMRQSGRQDFNAMIAASLASVLVPIAGISPFIACLYGHSGGGKTVCMMVCASLFGDPHGLMLESNSTVNSLVKQLGMLNNFPLFVDDLSKIRDRGDNQKYIDFIYTLCAGKEKSRLNKTIDMRDSASWSNVILTNMERPLAGYDMNGGAINRVLDFEMQDGDMFPDGNATVKNVTQNYGFIGPLFIDKVLQCFDDIPGIIDGYESKIKDAAAKAGHEKEQKQITPLALILTADQLFGEMLGDDIRLDLDWCVGNLKNIDDVSEMQRAWDSFIDEVSVNTNKFNPDDEGKYRGECWGYETDTEIEIFKTQLEQIAQKHNFSAKQFVDWCNRKGILKCNESKGMTSKVPIPGMSRRRCYVFKKPDPDEPQLQLPPAFRSGQNSEQDSGEAGQPDDYELRF